MNNKQLLLGVGAVAAVGLFGLAAAASAADRGDRAWRANLDTETREAIHEAMQNKDLEALQELAPDKFGDLSAEEFEQKLENRKERGFGKRAKHKFHKHMDQEKKEAIKAALDAGDYTSWKAAVGEDSKLLEKIDSEEDFSKLMRMHELREEARAIAAELGLGGHNNFGDKQLDA